VGRGDLFLRVDSGWGCRGQLRNPPLETNSLQDVVKDSPKASVDISKSPFCIPKVNLANELKTEIAQIPVPGMGERAKRPDGQRLSPEELGKV
jgi:hypothetical protein